MFNFDGQNFTSHNFVISNLQSQIDNTNSFNSHKKNIIIIYDEIEKFVFRILNKKFIKRFKNNFFIFLKQ
jgi:hypothetical protein